MPDITLELRKKMAELLSTADAPTLSICAELYKMILAEKEEDRPKAFELAINLYDDIDSDETKEISVSPYEKQRKALKKEYGDIVDSYIELFAKRNESTTDFYHHLWSSIQNELVFPDEAAKVFAFYYVIIDRRVPYFNLKPSYNMTSEAYRKLWHAHSSELKKIRYILSIDFNQRTEEASLLLDELGIPMPDNSATQAERNQYERKLVMMVQIANNRKPENPIEEMMRQLRER